MIESPPITPIVIEHRLHRLVCPCCSTCTCASLPPDVEASRYGPKLSGLVGLLTGSFPLSFSKVQLLLDQLLGVEYSCREDFVYSRGALSNMRQRLSSALISHGVQSAQGALCRGRLLTVVTSLLQQGRDIWPLLEQAWIAHHLGGERPSLLPDP